MCIKQQNESTNKSTSKFANQKKYNWKIDVAIQINNVIIKHVKDAMSDFWPI